MKWAEKQDVVYVENTGGYIYCAWMYTDEHTYYETSDDDEYAMCKFDDSDEELHGLNVTAWLRLPSTPLDLLPSYSEYEPMTEDEVRVFKKLKDALSDRMTCAIPRPKAVMAKRVYGTDETRLVLTKNAREMYDVIKSLVIVEIEDEDGILTYDFHGDQERTGLTSEEVNEILEEQFNWGEEE